VAITWTSIKRVSNGLTQPQAVAAWKELHKNELCDTCHGDRVMRCPSCHGTGVDQTKLMPCDECEGTGMESVCPSPRCNGTGKVDCPKPCLKLTQGTWTLREGKRWRDFRTARGTASFSEHHVGELIDAREGKSLGKCPTCDGTTKVVCPTCDGLGVIVCAKCDFAGVVGPPCPQCKEGLVACTACKGAGLKQTPQ
jgi:DnaJ-class molecular chaperone